MPWFKVDDGLAFHHKVVKAGNAAMGLWVRAGSWSAHQLSDGYVPDHMVPSLGTTSQARRLVDAGLWMRVEGGYQFHEWASDATGERRNFTAEEIAERRAKRVDAGRKGGRNSGGARSKHEASASAPAQANAQANASASAKQDAKQTSSTDPKGPDPKERSKDLSSRQAATDDPDFDRFWAIYPRRVAKRAAFQKWTSALKRADPDTIIDGAKRYADACHGRDPSYTKHPSTWLNGDCWDDEPSPTPAHNGHDCEWGKPMRNPLTQDLPW